MAGVMNNCPIPTFGAPPPQHHSPTLDPTLDPSVGPPHMDQIIFPKLAFGPNSNLMNFHGLVPALQSVPPSRIPPAPVKPMVKKEHLETKAAPSSDNGPIPADAIRHLLHEQSIKKRRLARKAELARLSRRRKKMRLTELEEENQNLREELSRLKDEHRRDQQDLMRLRSMQHQGLRSMQHQGLTLVSTKRRADSELLQPPTNRQRTSSESEGWLSSGSDSRSPTPGEVSPMTLSPDLGANPSPSAPSTNPLLSQSNAANRFQGLLNFLKKHIALIESDVAQSRNHSSLQLSFLEWVFNQKEAFYQDSQGLWNSLFVQELACTPEQMQRLTDLRQRMKTSITDTTELEAVLDRFKALVGSKRESNWENLSSSLTSVQITTLESWIQRFGGVCLKINL